MLCPVESVFFLAVTRTVTVLCLSKRSSSTLLRKKDAEVIRQGSTVRKLIERERERQREREKRKRERERERAREPPLNPKPGWAKLLLRP